MSDLSLQERERVRDAVRNSPAAMTVQLARQLGVPLTGDITGLFERLHSTEQTILKQLQAIEERLKVIENRH